MLDEDLPDLFGIRGVRQSLRGAQHRSRRLPQRQGGGDPAHRVRDAGDERRVEGVGDVEPGDGDASPFQPLCGGAERESLAGEHRLAGMIDVRDHHRAVRGSGARRLPRGLYVSCRAQHRAAIREGQRHHGEPASGDEPHAVLGRHHPRRRGRRELAEAVAEEDVSANAELAKEGVQRQGHRGHRRLAHLRLGEPRLGLRRLRRRMEERPQGAADTLVHLWPERLVEPVESLAEGGNLVVGLAQQADPLRALSGEEQGDLRFRKGTLPEETAWCELDGTFARGPRLDGLRSDAELLPEGWRRIGDHRQAGVPRRARGERSRDRREVSVERSAELACMPGHERGRRRGNEEQFGAVSRPRSPCARAPRGRRLLEDHVHVGAAEAEGVDADPARMIRRCGPRLRLARNVQARALELQLGPRHLRSLSHAAVSGIELMKALRDFLDEEIAIAERASARKPGGSRYERISVE